MESQPRGKFRSLLLTASGLCGFSFLFMFNKSSLSWLSDWFRWSPTSTKLLEQAELKLFSYIKLPFELTFVPISVSNTEEECKIRSLVVNKNLEGKMTPIVLLHGFASGVGLWILNIGSISQDRPLYALDMLGFGYSSRPAFNTDAEIAENQLVESIEQWRKQVGLNRFILLGHSMGGFLAASYAIKYPDRIEHLVLADPWGFPSPDLSVRKIEIPLWVKIIATMLRPFNPLAILRAAGPWGPNLIKRLRPDILRKFQNVVEDTSDVSNYIYHCNAQYPSGEAAFKSMSAFGWANRPMIHRIDELRHDIPISFIYGAQSWIDSSSGLQVGALRKDSFVEMKIIECAGHHVYADRADEFNEIVRDICRNCEKNKAVANTSASFHAIVDSVVNVAASEEIVCIEN